jgi:2-dehydro-3-deoxyphosphogluconate aldolase/(4S)-4-hydroxy-2-oxoglutarate aldolase
LREIRSILAAGPVIPVLVIEQEEDAVPIARAMLRGGVTVLEVTLRSSSALNAIAAISRDVPEAIVGAGTVVSEEQANRAADAGAKFLVSPGLTQNIARAAGSLRVPLLAGVATASDVLRGLELNLTAFKLFPAEAVGGVATLKAFAGPFPAISFCPTGGITAQNAAGYLQLPNVACVGGSWLAPADAVAAKNWLRIEELARTAAALRAIGASIP